MEEHLTETTDQSGHNAGSREISYTTTDAADQLEITMIVRRREEVSLHDELPRYEATGNQAFNGQVADALVRMAAHFNQHRPLACLPR